MVSAQPAAQSVSSLCDGTETGIKRIVLDWSSASGIDPPRSEAGSGAPPLLNRKPNWKRIQLLGYDLHRCDSKDWPVITDFSSTDLNTSAFEELSCLAVCFDDSTQRRKARPKPPLH